MNKKFFIFFGPPGSGKGTQADMLGEKLKLAVISPGELLRHAEATDKKLRAKIAPLIDKGKLVPKKIVEEILDKRLRKKDTARGAIFDGYPRDKSQLGYLIKKIKQLHGQDHTYAILVDVPDKEVRHRLGGRRVCDCGASYHIKFNPPKKSGICDLCGGKLTIRDDDKPSVISGRLKLYHQKIKPLLDYWKKQNKLMVINGTGKIKRIQNDIIKVLKKIN